MPPPPLTITANNESTVYGAPVPTLSATYSGFVNGDSPASLTTPVTLSTAAVAGSPPGTYTISASGATSPNYQITFVAGTLTISQASTTTGLTASATSILSGEAVTLTATIAVVAPAGGLADRLRAVLRWHDFARNRRLERQHRSPYDNRPTRRHRFADDSVSGRSQFHRKHVGHRFGDCQARHSDDNQCQLVGQPVGLRPSRHLDCDRITLLWQRFAHGNGYILRRVDATRHRDARAARRELSRRHRSRLDGSQSITVVYSGDSNYSPSTSAALSQTVNQDATTTKVTSSSNPSVYGQSVTFTATVSAASPGSGSPTGTVTFYDGATSLGSGTLDGTTNTLSTTFVAVGAQSITAVYSGDPNFTTSTSTALTQTVNQDSSTTTIVSSVNPSVYGQPLTFTASVSANSPGSGAPTGTITFSYGSTTLGTVSLTNGMASFTTSAPMPVGDPNVKASYSGDTNFKASSGTVAQTVNQDATTTAVVSSANPSVYGESVTFTATVSANAPGSGTPTGSVTFTNGSTTLGTVALSNGTASIAPLS